MDIFVTCRKKKKKNPHVMLDPVGRVDFPVCCVYTFSILPSVGEVLLFVVIAIAVRMEEKKKCLSVHKCTRMHTGTVNRAPLLVCGKRPSELFLALTASRVPSSPLLSPLSRLFSLSLSHSQGCQAALTMNQSCVRLFDCSWGVGG